MKISTAVNVAYLSVKLPILHPVRFFRFVPFGSGVPLRITAIAIRMFEEVVSDDQYQVARYIKPGDIVVDAGGNVGTFALFAASRGATVYTFEPESRTFAILKKNVAKYPNIIPARKGLGDTVRTASFNISKNSGSSSFEMNSDPKSYIGTESAEITTIDTLDLPRLDFLKMDTEGYERQILEGGRKTIEKFLPVIACSGYHHPEDKKVLPETVHSISPKYKVELSGNGGEDFVFVPEK